MNKPASRAARPELTDDGVLIGGMGEAASRVATSNSPRTLLARAAAYSVVYSVHTSLTSAEVGGSKTSDDGLMEAILTPARLHIWFQHDAVESDTDSNVSPD